MRETDPRSAPRLIASIVETNFALETPGDFTLGLLRAMFVGLTAALFVVWLAS